MIVITVSCRNNYIRLLQNDLLIKFWKHGRFNFIAGMYEYLLNAFLKNMEHLWGIVCLKLAELTDVFVLIVNDFICRYLAVSRYRTTFINEK